MKSQALKKYKLPDRPGIYMFMRGKEILYIGKATSLRNRVRSYFSKDLIGARGPLILDMTTVATGVDWQETDSVLEALILEANLIKKYQPKYNTKEKDNKSFNYVCITRDKMPQVLIVRGRNLRKEAYGKGNVFGPYTNGAQLRDAMKIIRRIFPYVDSQSAKRNNFEFYRQLGLVPDMEVVSSSRNSLRKVLGSPRRIHGESRPDRSEMNFSTALSAYKKNIANLKLFFQGKKKRIITNLKKEMLALAKKKEFEKASEIKKKIFALEHINDVALIKESDINTSRKYRSEKVLGSPRRIHGEARPDYFQNDISATFRIEAYDIAHMAGKNMVGVMTVVENGEAEKGEYKKFIIRTQSGANDTGALEEVLSRRFRHFEWGLPALVVMDGSTAQINIAKKVLNFYQLKIPIVSVVKDDKHKAKAIMGDEEIIKQNKKAILLANSEAHRFAIAFHKKKRNENFLN